MADWSKKATIGEAKDLLVSVEFDQRPKSKRVDEAYNLAKRSLLNETGVDDISKIRVDDLEVGDETRKACQELLKAWLDRNV